MNKGSVSVNNISSEYIRKNLNKKNGEPIPDPSLLNVNTPCETPINANFCSENNPAPAETPRTESGDIPAPVGSQQEQNVSVPAAGRRTIDISEYLPMHYSEFIPLMYQIFFNRQPDISGMASFIQLIRNGASNAAVAYIFAISDEFADRADVKDIKLYKKKYKKYIGKLRIKRIPLFGRLAQIAALPSQLSTFYDNYEYYNGKLMNTAAALNEKYMGICANIDSLTGKLNDTIAYTSDNFCRIYGNIEELNRKLSDTAAASAENYRRLDGDIRDLDKKLSVIGALTSERYSGLGRNIKGLREKLEDTAAAFSENCRSLNGKITGIAEETLSLGKSVGTFEQESRAAFEALNELTSEQSRMTVALHEKSDGISQLITAFSENCRSLNGKITGIAEETLSLGKSVGTFEQESRAAFEALNELTSEQSRMTVALHEKSDGISQLITAVSQKTDELPEYISGIAQKTKTVIPGILGGVIAVMAGDFFFGVPSEEWGLAQHLSLNGFFEKGTEEFFRSLLRPGMNVLDVGANLGIFTLHALKADCNVYSFEPIPRIFRILEQNVKVNGFAVTGKSHLYNCAVSDKNGTSDFYCTPQMCGQSSNLFEPLTQTDEKISVQVVTLDEKLNQAGKIDVIKMDVEGAEYSALCGMKKLISRNPKIKIIMEFGPENMKRARVEPSDLLKLIKELGFRYYLIDEATGNLRSVNEEELMQCFSVNLLLTKEKIDL